MQKGTKAYVVELYSKSGFPIRLQKHHKPPKLYIPAHMVEAAFCSFYANTKKVEKLRTFTGNN